jgi:hypothetical protein
MRLRAHGARLPLTSRKLTPMSQYRRSVEQNHLFEHFGDRVALETVLVDGEVRVRSWRGTRSPVSALNRMLQKQTYGRGGVFAVSKRQLDGRTLAHHGLR